MGIYDREYYRDEPRGLRLGGDWSAVTTLIVINVAVFLAELFTSSPRSGSWVENNLALQPDLFHHPLQFWQLLTYGFVHDSQHFMHILFNMIALFVFGRDVEIVYGRKEFYKIYLSLVILSGLVFVALQLNSNRPSPVEGASGGIMGIAVLFACNFPRRMMLIFPIPIPIPAYLLVGFYVLMDLLVRRRPATMWRTRRTWAGRRSDFCITKPDGICLIYGPANCRCACRASARNSKCIREMVTTSRRTITFRQVGCSSESINCWKKSAAKAKAV